jgi:hypothetical protein
MSVKIIEITVMEGIDSLLFVFAYLIGVKGKMELIEGYNEHTAERVRDKAGLRRLIARGCVLVGPGSALMPFLTLYSSGYSNGLAYCIGGYGGESCGSLE